MFKYSVQKFSPQRSLDDFIALNTLSKIPNPNLDIFYYEYYFSCPFYFLIIRLSFSSSLFLHYDVNIDVKDKNNNNEENNNNNNNFSCTAKKKKRKQQENVSTCILNAKPILNCV